MYQGMYYEVSIPWCRLFCLSLAETDRGVMLCAAILLDPSSTSVKPSFCSHGREEVEKRSQDVARRRAGAGFVILS